MPDYNVSEMPQYPGTNFHDLNLDWLLSEMKKLREEWEEWQAEHEEVGNE